MSVEKRFELVTRGTIEVITEKELRLLLERKERPRAYWGFEPSGLMHIGMGLLCGAKIRDLVEAGFEFIVLLADWHAWINDKLGGELENIKVAADYFEQCFSALGIRDVKYVRASEIVEDADYWRLVFQVAKHVTLRRVRRALPIMGRDMSMVDVKAAWTYYPCMQVADVFYLGVDVTCAGLDQRKAYILAREVAGKLKLGKPVSVHTPLLVGLMGPKRGERGMFDENREISLRISSKMSKSVPDTCIFVHDSPEEVERKILKAYCPPRQVKYNPVMEITRYIVFSWKRELEIQRPAEYGGPIEFRSYADLEEAYLKGELHPLDLKKGVIGALNDILKPVREHFKQHPRLLKKLLEIEVTR